VERESGDIVMSKKKKRTLFDAEIRFKVSFMKRKSVLINGGNFNALF